MFKTLMIIALALTASMARAQSADLLQQLNGLNSMIDANQDLDAADITHNFKLAYKTIYGVQTTSYDSGWIAQHGQELMNQIFNLRLKLRSQIPMLIEQHKDTPQVMAGMHDMFRIARYAEDLIGEVMSGSTKIKKVKMSKTALKIGGIDTMMPAGQTSFDFRSGDVLLVRGTRYNSAAIARISDVQSQFSHAAMIYIDPQGKKWVMEALIEDGLDLHTLDSVLNEGLGRAVLFRYHDLENPGQSAAIANRAAKYMYDRAVGAQKKQIEYDFSMNPDGYDRLFCSKVVRDAFDTSSGGKIKIPMYESGLTMKNRDFFDALGITVKKTFAPSDLELDPRFDVVAEWRDFRLTVDMRIKDMLLMQIFNWMETENMHFVAPLWLKDAAAMVKWGVTHSELVDKEVTKLVGKIPSYMRQETISQMVMLQLTADPLEKRLVKMEADFEKEHGVPMHPRQMLDALETIRRDHPRTVGFLQKI